MNKSRLIFAIAMLALIVICIVFSSLAWFRQDIITVATEPLEVIPSNPTSFTIGDVQTFQTMGNYKGQTGLSFYRYVENPDVEGYEYIYYDDGVYETRATVEQVLARAKAYYFPYVIADADQLETPALLYWHDVETELISAATAEQIERAADIVVWSSMGMEYRTATRAQLIAGVGLMYRSYDISLSTYVYNEATEEQIAYRTNLYYGNILPASPNQLAAGRYVYVTTEGGYYPATVAEIDEATRVLYYDSASDTFTMASRIQIEARLALRKGQTADVATEQDLLDGLDIYYTTDDETFVAASAAQIQAALLLYYKDRGEKMTKDFKIYSFTASETQNATYYWRKEENDDGDYVSYKRYSATVAASSGQYLTQYPMGTAMYFEIYRMTNGSEVFTVYNSSGDYVFQNWGEYKNVEIEYPYMGSNRSARVRNSLSLWLTLTWSNTTTKDEEIYYMKDTSGNNYQLVFDRKDNDGPAYTLYSMDGTIRKKQYKSTEANNSIVFTKTEVTAAGVNYAGQVECSKRKGYAEDTCRTVNYGNEEQTNYTAQSKDYILQCSGTAGHYVYRVIKPATGTVLFDSSDENTVIEVHEELMTTYAIVDDVSKMDEVYSVSKQFNTVFPNTQYPHYLKVEADKIGVVPVYADAVNTLSAVDGVETKDVYYTYVNDGSVDFGFEYTVTGLGSTTEVVYVTNYDGSKQTQITMNYGDYSAASYGDLTYVTSRGYPLYIKVGEGDATDYLQIHTGMSGMNTLSALLTGIANESIVVYCRNGSRYATYSDRYGSIGYDIKTIDGNRLYYHGIYPVATNEQIAAGTNIYYWNGSAFVAATADMMHASGLLFHSADGIAFDAATASEITAGVNLYYYDSDYVELTPEEIAANRHELYYRTEATPEEIAEGTALFYWNGTDYELASVAIVRASGTLYYSTDGLSYTEATAAQITEGSDLYCRVRNESDTYYYSVDVANRKTLFHILYTEASAAQVERGESLCGRVMASVVWNLVDGERTTLLYAASKGDVVTTTLRTMYFLPNELLYDHFYVEVDLYNVTEDIMLGTFYPDSEGVLLTGFLNDDPYVFAASDRSEVYRCVIRVYFMDGTSYHNLRDDANLTYTYMDNDAAPMFAVSAYENINPFTFSDYKYIASNILLRLKVGTQDVTE